jgi:hypothetical protein
MAIVSSELIEKLQSLQSDALGLCNTSSLATISSYTPNYSLVASVNLPNPVYLLVVANSPRYCDRW